jgi:hypothetical protein
MCRAEDQHAVQELTAQRADEPLADRVHPRSLDGGARDRGASGLEYGVERGGEVRAAVADQEPEVLEPVVEVQGQVPGLLHRPRAGGVRGDAAQVHPAGAVLDEHQHVQPCQQHRVHVQEVHGHDPGRPGRRRVLVSYFRAASLRCQASSVAGVTGKTPAHRRRGMNGASAANQARSAASYRIRPAVRRSTTFSCRSTSSSASFA